MSGKIIHSKEGFAITAVEYSNVATGQKFNHQGVPFWGLRFGAWCVDDKHLYLDNFPSVTLKILDKYFVFSILLIVLLLLVAS